MNKLNDYGLQTKIQSNIFAAVLDDIIFTFTWKKFPKCRTIFRSSGLNGFNRNINRIVSRKFNQAFEIRSVVCTAYTVQYARRVLGEICRVM